MSAAIDALRAPLDYPDMERIWSSQTDLDMTEGELREEVQLHIARHLGESEAAFIDADGWAGSSREPGPPVDVLIAPPEGERRFAYVTSFGASLKPILSASGDDAPDRVEFALAVPQTGAEPADRALLNLGANTVRQFAKLVHLQPVRVGVGDTVAFAGDPKPVFEGSRQVAFAFMRPRLPGEGFDTLAVAAGERLDFVSPVPIYREELDAGHDRGGRYLLDALHRGGVTEMLDFGRPLCVPRARSGRSRWLTPLARLARLFSGGGKR